MTNSFSYEMSFFLCVLCFCVLFTHGSAVDGEDKLILEKSKQSKPPLDFPKESSPSTPILKGNDPKASNLPPKIFPSPSTELNSSDPPILSGNKDDITNNHAAHKEKSTQKESNLTSTEALSDSSDGNKGRFTEEQEDMMHSVYKGGHDVDEILKPDNKENEKDKKKAIEKDEKKAIEKDEKKSILPKKDPKSEFDISPNFDNKGPKLMNETKTKTGESVIESTSKMMAMSSSVLSSTHQVKHHGIIEPAKTVATVLLSVVVILCLGLIGLLVWKKIAMRRFGRDVLINEDDFDEVSDMHTFESAQIQIT